MTASVTGSSGPAPGAPGALARACDAIDRVNERMGLLWGFTILLVTAAVVWEVVARDVFSAPTQWSNETTVYLSAMAYLIAGGYALLHRRHVRIDVIYERLSPRRRALLDLFTFVFFAAYALTLVWIGGIDAISALRSGEGTGTPWNPVIWPVKAAIPLAGLLLLAQGIVNLLRDLGVVRDVPDEGPSPGATP